MFANPAFLLAILGCAVPVLIHLIWKRKLTALPYPTLRFLRQAGERLSTRRKLRELILLALRVAAVLLVALALARPGLRVAAGGSLGATSDVVLVIDTSASMRLATATGSRLDCARDRATAVLATLQINDRAAVLATLPARETADGCALTGDRADIRAALQGMVCLDGAGAWTDAIDHARELLEASTAPNREVHLFSDMQARAFSDKDAIRHALNNLPAGTSVFLWSVPGAPPERNVAIEDVQTDARPKVTGRVLKLRVRIRNRSAREVQTSVTAGWSGEPPSAKPLVLEGGQSVEVPFALTCGRSGFSQAEVRLGSDDADYDNVWPLAVEIRGPLQILLLTADTPGSPETDEGFYLARALDPTGDGALSGLQVRRATIAETPTLGVDAFDVVMLCETRALPTAGRERLLRWVRAGGGLMVWMGTDETAARQAGGVLSSAASAPPVIAGKDPFRLLVSQTSNALFDDVRDAGGQVQFQDVAILRARTLERTADSVVLAQLSNDAPALVQKKLGQGQVLTWAFGPHPRDGNLPLKPVFLSLLHRSVAVLSASGGADLRATAGSAMTLAGHPTGKEEAKPIQLKVFEPNGQTSEQALQDRRLTVRDTGRIGIYRVEPQGAEDAGLPRGFAVTPDPAESDPEYLDTAAMQDLLGARVAVCSEEVEPAHLLTEARQGKDLFGPLVFLALLALLTEVLIANRIAVRSRSPGERKSVGVSIAAVPMPRKAASPPAKTEGVRP